MKQSKLWQVTTLWQLRNNIFISKKVKGCEEWQNLSRHSLIPIGEFEAALMFGFKLQIVLLFWPPKPD